DEARRHVGKQMAEADARLQMALEKRTTAESEASHAKLQHDSAVRSHLAAQEAAGHARKQLEETEWQLREGIYPAACPTAEEIMATRERLGYREGLFHCAVAGIGGCGKSSLVNALRGLRNSDTGAAATGTAEVTDSVARFLDPSPGRRVVWYDVPGAGRQAVPDRQYLTEYGLYAFDCIIVLFDTRLAAMDIALLRDAERFSIPTFIVRSKSRQHIRNLAADMAGGDDDDDDATDGEGCDPSARTLERARELYIQQTRTSVAENLAKGGLSGQRVYLVDKDTLVKAAKGESARDAIDDVDLVRDL
ncbi:hypothetical protein FOMPIDRAFT_15577, partial [Fomitopsis schrenkii]